MCDTFVALPTATAGGKIIFGKNSDREPNEAQALEYHPATEYQAGSVLRCTYLEIPQVPQTNAALLSRPFWMWGAEIGANEHGVVIGNEAVWSKMPLVKQGLLTGMDLLRLGLERSATAETALEAITELLTEYGQGGECGYQSRGMVYHNSFIIADPREAWVLETAGSLWVALHVKKTYSISNGLTIGEHYHLAHPGLVDTARKKGWLKKGRTFNFARCYSDWFYTTFSGNRTRRSCTAQLLEKNYSKLDLKSAFSILRDHGRADYRPDEHFLMNCICAHSANLVSRHSAQSTGSLVAELDPKRQEFWATATSAPCTSIFKPYRFENGPPPNLGKPPDANYNPGSIWWRHERLHRTILRDFNARLSSIESERNKLEEYYLKQTAGKQSGNISAITSDAFNTADRVEADWLTRLAGAPVKNQPRYYYRRYWKKQNSRSGVS